MTFEYLSGNTESSHLLHSVWGNSRGDQSYWIIMQHQTDFLYYRDGKMAEGTAGQILIVPPFEKYLHTSRADAKKGFVDDWVRFECDLTKDFFERLGIPLGVAFDVADNYLIRSYITKMLLENALCDIGYEHLISSFFHEMIVKIARQRKHNNKSDNNLRLTFDKIRHSMLRDYGHQHTLNELASKVGYSTGHFALLYRKFYGISPIDDLINYRISIAKLELKMKENSISEISRKCGFASIHHFSRFFKKHVGVTPSKFAQNETE